MSSAPEAETATLTLRNGMRTTIRPIRPEDAPRLQALHSRLSPDSVYFRFLDQRALLPEAEAAHLANVDYRTRMALVACVDSEGEEQVIGVARYGVVGPEDSGVAEAAVVVEDRFHGQGLGTELLTRLMQYAAAHGVRVLQGTIHSANDRILRMIQRSGFPVSRTFADGVWEIRADLTRAPE